MHNSGVNKLPQVGDELPAEWVNIREYLKALGVDHISDKKYYEICADHGLLAERADYLSRYFHDLGVTVHYSQDPLLKKTVVLNPDWAVDGVYNVLDTPSIEERQGRFNKRDLAKIWKEDKYADKQPELLALMENYELCFKLPGREEYIAPELLDANPVHYKPINRTGRLSFIYQYEFMPAGLITRLIVKIHRLIDENCFWRSGVVVRDEGARAAIVEDVTTKQIRIDIEADDRKKELLAIIRNHFSDIYADFNRRIEYKELIPCNCGECSARIEEDKEPHYFNWQTVQSYARVGRDTIVCDHPPHAEVNVATLMGAIADKPDSLIDGPTLREPVSQDRPKGEPVNPVSSPTPWTERWETLAAGAIGIVFLSLLLSIAIFIPNPTEFQLFVFRIVLALAAGAFGALIPGFIEVEFKNWLRAGGALALFAIVFFLNPPALITGP